MSIRITCTQPGFRRAGIAHPAGPTDHPSDRFSGAQLEQLQAEPRLVVEIIKDAVAETTDRADPPGRLAESALDQLVAHIATLNPDDAKAWTKEDGPAMRAMPDGCTTEQRDEAWTEFLRRADGADEQAEG